MLIKRLLIIAIAVPNFIWCTSGFTDEVLMKTGEKFHTSNAWQDGDKIRFDMQGLLVDVDRNDVATIIHSNGLTDTGATSDSPVHNQSLSTGAKVPFQKPEQGTIAPRSAAVPEPQPPTAPDHGGSFNPVWISTNQGTGLQGIQWQMKPGDIPGLALVEIDPAFGGIDQYWCPDQNFQWGQVPLNGWVYGFWREQLYSIMIWVDGNSAYENLRKKVATQFGPGTKSVNNEDRYIWVDATTQRMLEYDAQLHTGIFVMRSSKVDTLIKEQYP